MIKKIFFRSFPELCWAEICWNSFCLFSILGIWPRWIEPHCIATHALKVPVRGLAPSLCGLRLVQFSDLHLHKNSSERFLRRLSKKINNLKADLILFTGDFLVRSRLECPDLLVNFLNSLQAKEGCFAVLGNHDYAFPITRNKEGHYTIVEKEKSPILEGFSSLLCPKKNVSTGVFPKVAPHDELLSLLKKTPFKVLHNETTTLSIRGASISLCGLGEYMAGHCLPKKAFSSFVHPLIVLLHNPDGFSLLKGIDADLILCGHTHGAQVNLPFIWKRLSDAERPEFKRGMYHLKKSKLYINRGVGGLPSFRCFSFPEISVFELVKESE